MTECEPNGVALAEEEYTYRADEDQALSEAVVHAVTDFKGVEMNTAAPNKTQDVLDPLYNTIDPDALDSLFQTSEDGEPRLGTVEFWYSGCEITVHSTGLIKVNRR